MILRLSDQQYPISFDEIGAAHPSTAIHPNISDADLRPLGYARVEQTPAPTIDPDTQSVAEGAPALVDGTYRRTWEVSDLSPEAQASILDGKKTLARSLVEQNRDAKCRANVTAHTRQWQADSVSQDLLNKAITLAQAGLPLPTEWRDADNSNLTISTIADLLAIAGAIGAQTQAAYAWSWSTKAAIDAATTAAALAAIDLS